MLVNQIKVVMLACALCMMAGCTRTQPVYNVSEPIGSSVSRKVSSSQMGKIIVAAAREQKWDIRADGANKYKASIAWRDHSAAAEISYTASHYEINLLSSHNLLGGDGMIHKKYNQRVQKLKRAIDRKISEVSTQ